jgi:murein DD-endopeptidase MepM/ murein hydrolase activator NlpD
VARRTPPRLVLLALPLLLLGAGSALAAGEARVAALQVALRAKGVYAGSVDGIDGATTRAAVAALQRRRRLAVDGVAGPRTLRALGRLGRHPLGSRVLHAGETGWDVAELQFELAWHGFPSGAFDGVLGGHTAGALRRFQRWAGLHVDGRAGAGTLAALAAPPATCPLALRMPVDGVLGDRFGPRGDRFHAGLDLIAPFGMRVHAAAPGRISWAGPRDGWGLLVVVAHADGVRTFYAHLSRIDVRLGERVATGDVLGRIGATGDATGPHLHFEVRVRGAAVDPLSALR